LVGEGGEVEELGEGLEVDRFKSSEEFRGGQKFIVEVQYAGWACISVEKSPRESFV